MAGCTSQCGAAMSFDLTTVLRESTLAHHGEPMLRLGPLTLGYGQVDQLSAQVAAGLRGAGLQRGDTVALPLPDVPQLVLAHFGALRAGLTPGQLRRARRGRRVLQGAVAAYEYPREVVVIDELPKGPSGKVLKTELRNR